jgi:hypothetical protein
MFAAFEAGMQSGIAPQLLARNQTGFNLNASIRGGFIKPRPPLQKIVINFGGNSALQTLVQTGLFQGAGYYRPDTGTESLVAQISGHLLKFTQQGSVWTCTDISIPGDLNNPTAPQVWMWQAENYLIVQDGTGVLPIFFDGVTSRRSAGDSQVLGITTQSFTPPAIGATVTLQLEDVYTGPFNVPVILNGEFYQPVQNPNGYVVTLTNLTAQPGEDIPAQSQLVIQPSTIGSVTQAAQGSRGSGALNVFVTLSTPNLPISGAGSSLSVNVSGALIQNLQTGTGNPVGSPVPVQQPMVLKIAADGVSTELQITYSAFGYLIIPQGSIVTYNFNAPNVIVGNTVNDFIVPGANAQVSVTLTKPFTGTNGTVVYIGTEAFTISNPAPPSPSTTLTLINLTDGTTTPVSAPADILSVPELPAGRMGAYGMGCNAVSLTDGISYIIGDVVGSASGTPALNYRDAVLKVTQNTFLSGGGTFRLPGTGDIITAMVFPTIQDASLGQGALVIGTQFSMFSNQVPGTNPSTWDTLTFPIQTESLKDKGPQGQNSTILLNSDVFFRSSDGIASLVSARRDFFDWGNHPVSNEMVRVLNDDDQNLLNYGSMISFDNRLFCTAGPISTNNGVVHQSMVTLQLDLLSSLRTKQPPAWEGMWTGINIFQLIAGRVNGVKRAFAFTYNFNQQILEIYELLPEISTQVQDNSSSSIGWAFETPVAFGPSVKPMTDLIQLRDGEVYLSDIQGDVEVVVYWKPDYYPCWTVWREFDVCQSADATDSQPGYRMRIGLGEPSVKPCEAGNNRPLRIGHFFQFRVEITGSCAFNGIKISAIPHPQQEFAPIECSKKSCQVIDCTLPNDVQFYSLQGFPTAAPLPTPLVPVPTPFNNQQVLFPHSCGAGSLLLSAVNFPTWITLDSNNQQLVGAPGTFQGTTQADANNQAQTALNNFGNALLASGKLFCTSTAPATCAGTDTGAYQIQGYFNGLISNPFGQANAGTPWDGTFQFQQIGSLCNWAGTNVLFSRVANGTVTCILIGFSAGTWTFSMFAWLGSGSASNYRATKTTGSNPAGVYTFVSGAAGGPATLTIVPLPGVTATQININSC